MLAVFGMPKETEEDSVTYVSGTMLLPASQAARRVFMRVLRILPPVASTSEKLFAKNLPKILWS
jgi:hypothetical protein